MKKRYVSLILAAALSAAALAGCGGSGTEAPGSKETTGKEAAGQASAQDTGADGELSGEILAFVYTGPAPGDHPEGGRQVHGRESGCEDQH